MNIVQVTFKPKPRAPVDCKDVSYLVNVQHEGIAISIAAEVFKLEHKLHKYYGDAIAMRKRVL